MPGFIKAFGVGLGFGVAIGLLYAPKSGKESRKYVAETAGMVKDRTVTSATWAGKKTMQIVDAVRAPVDLDGEMDIPIYRSIEYYIEEVPEEEEAVTAGTRQERPQATAKAEKEVMVKNLLGDEVGQLMGVLMDPEKNEVEYGVVALKNRTNEQELCAVPWSEMKQAEEGNYQSDYTCGLPERTLEEAPKFTQSELQDQTQPETISQTQSQIASPMSQPESQMPPQNQTPMPSQNQQKGEAAKQSRNQSLIDEIRGFWRRRSDKSSEK
jgi:gas vesicle protein